MGSNLFVQLRINDTQVRNGGRFQFIINNEIKVSIFSQNSIFKQE